MSKGDIRVTFKGSNLNMEGQNYMTTDLQVLPKVGDVIIFDMAKRDTHHKVTSIIHRVGTYHRIDVNVVVIGND